MPEVTDEFAVGRALSSRPSRGALAGLLTAGVTLGVAELVAAFVDETSSPVISVAGVAIDATPEWLKSFSIRTFGANGKVALVGGIVGVLVLLAAGLGIVSTRRPAAGYSSLLTLRTSWRWSGPRPRLLEGRRSPPSLCGLQASFDLKTAPGRSCIVTRIQ